MRKIMPAIVIFLILITAVFIVNYHGLKQKENRNPILQKQPTSQESFRAPSTQSLPFMTQDTEKSVEQSVAEEETSEQLEALLDSLFDEEASDYKNDYEKESETLDESAPDITESTEKKEAWEAWNPNHPRIPGHYLPDIPKYRDDLARIAELEKLYRLPEYSVDTLRELGRQHREAYEAHLRREISSAELKQIQDDLIEQERKVADNRRAINNEINRIFKSWGEDREAYKRRAQAKQE